MVVDGVVFLCGLVVGLMLAWLSAWIVLGKKGRINTQMLADGERERKQLSESLSGSLSQVAMLHERALIAKTELEQARVKLDDLYQENNQLSVKLATALVHNDKNAEYLNQRVHDLQNVHDRMKETFATISQDALFKNTDMLSSSFKQSMEHFFKASEKERLQANETFASLVNPLKESLVSVDKKIHELETTRQGAYAGLKEQIEGLLKSQTILQKETHHLSRALSAPVIRGRWGEMQLRRVVELSGLSAHCDFVEQANISDGEGTLRPDMIVTLPKNKKIIVDAKAPLEFFSNNDATAGENAELQRGQELAALMRRHLLALKKKSYHSLAGESPEFVVMFLPGEAFLHWALMADPALLEFAAQNEIIMATPVTLIALLKAIAFGFRQESIANNIEEVRRLSQQLIDRIYKVASHFEKLGKSLKQATESYNQTVASLDSRVLVTARKLTEIRSLSGDAEEIFQDGLPLIDSLPREVSFKEPVNEERNP